MLIFSFFLCTCKNCHKTQMHNLIAFKFGIRETGYKAHLDSNFGLNISINGWVINDYSWKCLFLCTVKQFKKKIFKWHVVTPTGQMVYTMKLKIGDSLEQCCTSNRIGYWKNHISAAIFHTAIASVPWQKKQQIQISAFSKK